MTNKYIEALEKIASPNRKVFCEEKCAYLYGCAEVNTCKNTQCEYLIATQALTPQECDVTTQVDVTECSFYNDHDCSEPECDEMLDDRFLPIHLCSERTDCSFKKYNKCKFFQNGYCGEFCAKDGEEYYFGNGLQKCSDNPNCYYKQLHSQQKTFTLDEIKEILENTFEKFVFNYRKDNKEYIDLLLQEFEKEVKND